MKKTVKKENCKCMLCNKAYIDDYNAIFITAHKIKEVGNGAYLIGNLNICKKCYKTLKNLISIMQKSSGSKFIVNKCCA